MVENDVNISACTVNRVNTDISTGLTENQVQERIRAGCVNTPVSSPTKTVKQIILSNVLTYFNMIFFVLALALILVGSFNNLTFLIVVVVNTAIGIVQEINAKKTLDKLTLMSEPKAVVIRDGEEVEISTSELVLDDVVLFSAGNQISADAVVISGSVQANESLITGESDEITKEKGDKLLSGSFVISGKCYARLEKVGKDSFVSKLTLDAKKLKKKEQPGMMKSLTRLVQVIGIVIIPLGLAIFFQQKNLLGLATKLNVEKTTAALIGMIPEGLYLLANVALAVSVIRLAKKKTLVHDLKCIETLARVDVLCVDKTGTVTENVMQVKDIVPLDDYNGKENLIDSVMRDFSGNMSADNNTMNALKEHYASKSFRRAKSVVPFSSTTKFSAVSFGNDESYLLGAPEFVLKHRYGDYAEIVEEYTTKGYRVVLLAKVTASYDGNETDLIPMSLILLSNPIRPDARETFEYFVEQGVNVKVISGDNPYTVAAAAKEAGIPNYEKCIDLSTVKNDEDLEKVALEYTIFGRVTPDQKRKLVRFIKKAGHTVAMTGDGVNDVLALKEADCSIAMASGSDVACQISHLVLLDSNFSSMPSVVAEGRRVINNIQRSASLFLVKNIFSFILTLVSIFAVFEYPLTPSQISLVSLVTIGIPAFVLALEKNEDLIQGKFLRNVITKALPAALTDLFVLIGVILFSIAFKMPSSVTSTVSAILVGIVGFAMIYKICKPFNVIRIVLISSTAVMFLLAILIMPKFFSLYPIGFGGALVLGVFTLLIPSVLYVISLGFEKANFWINKLLVHIKNNMDK